MAVASSQHATRQPAEHAEAGSAEDAIFVKLRRRLRFTLTLRWR